MPSAGIPAIGNKTEMQTSAPPGIPGAPIANRRIVKAIVINTDVEMSRPNIRAMKNREIVWVMHDPFMLIVVPKGIPNEYIDLSIPKPLSAQSIETGMAAELEHNVNPVIMAGDIRPKKLED